MKAINKLSLVSVVVLSSTLICAANSANAFSESDFQMNFKSFTQAKSDADAEKAATGFQEMLKAEPANPLLMAYAGAATTKLATTTIFPWKKMSYSEDGLAMLDKALQLSSNTNAAAAMHGTVPVALEAKFVAANTFLAVPGFMNRGGQGQKLLNEILQHPLFSSTAVDFRGAVWMRAANLAIDQKHPELAKTYLKAIIQANAPQAANANSLLKGIPS
ncbi:hypothetical protein ACO0KY_03335 [Undibacterium sp. Dicai25W]|uniref:hypothetical protein n=1 Tax=Undibacterium sp. Dicai25W TaxID=3413034 RepID=UPI003BF0EB19